MATEIEKLSNKIDGLDNNVKIILFYLNNDAATGKKGLVQDVADLKDEIIAVKDEFSEFVHEYKKKEAVKNARVGVISAIVSGGITLVAWIVKTFIIK